MAIYKQIFPTKWPLFIFNLVIWHLKIYTGFFSPGIDNDGYEYVFLRLDWRNKNIFQFRLFDTYARQSSRLEGVLTEPYKPALEKLERVKKTVEEEIEKLKKYERI